MPGAPGSFTRDTSPLPSWTGRHPERWGADPLLSVAGDLQNASQLAGARFLAVIYGPSPQKPFSSEEAAQGLSDLLGLWARRREGIRLEAGASLANPVRGCWVLVLEERETTVAAVS